MKPAGLASSRSYYKGAAARLSVVRDIDVCGTRARVSACAPRSDSRLRFVFVQYSPVMHVFWRDQNLMISVRAKVDLERPRERQKECGSMLP